MYADTNTVAKADGREGPATRPRYWRLIVRFTMATDGPIVV